ncbi:MAG: polyprenol monophosphomannose synthase [Polyangiales bacterium]|nr:polyprenol monophosphomannose synthase [Myxococcales bacterium]MCB9657957.1 polyprenol monophosphomannose synthase [Sandaracinaceae bacterium]
MSAERVLIVTPTYNERENLARFLAGVFEVLPRAHVLVVDDASPDGTGDLAEELAADDERVQVLHRPGKLGLGTAYLDGFRWGLAEGFDVFFEMDTDLSHDPRYLPDFLDALADGADLVIGSRNVPGGGVEGWGLGRHVLSKGGSLYSRTWLGLPVQDLTSGYKAFRRAVLEKLALESVSSNGYSFQIELTYRAALAGCTVREVPIIFVDRRAGHSKMSRRIVAEAVLMVPALRLRALLGKL